MDARHDRQTPGEDLAPSSPGVPSLALPRIARGASPASGGRADSRHHPRFAPYGGMHGHFSDRPPGVSRPPPRGFFYWTSQGGPRLSPVRSACVMIPGFVAALCPTIKCLTPSDGPRWKHELPGVRPFLRYSKSPVAVLARGRASHRPQGWTSLGARPMVAARGPGSCPRNSISSTPVWLHRGLLLAAVASPQTSSWRVVARVCPIYRAEGGARTSPTTASPGGRWRPWRPGGSGPGVRAA